MNGTDTHESRYTVWHFVGCGCTVLLLLGLIGAGVVFFLGRQMVEGMKAGIEDPEARAARSREVLGWEELPEGYVPGITIRVPLMMTMTMLGDRELPEDDPFTGQAKGDLFGDRGFLYFKMRAFGGEPEEVEENAELDFDFDPERRLADGEVEVGGAVVGWVARIGVADLAEGPARAISTDLSIRCLSDPYVRRGIWFEKAPEALTGEGAAEVGSEEEAAALEGTPADPEAIRGFLGHFELCG